jgi:hypothetical protein
MSAFEVDEWEVHVIGAGFDGVEFVDPFFEFSQGLESISERLMLDAGICPFLKLDRKWKIGELSILNFVLFFQRQFPFNPSASRLLLISFVSNHS